jgi:hypothetical protein
VQCPKHTAQIRQSEWGAVFVDTTRFLHNVAAMNQNAFPIITYRWIVFALAAVYAFHQIVASSYDGAGGPFRYLTNWALFLSLYSAGIMLAYSLQITRRRRYVTASVAAVLNLLVVVQYWRLYSIDPGLVTIGAPNHWLLEYYLHLLGPVLQWIDAVFILGAFRRHRRSLAALTGISVSFVVWSEMFVAPFNLYPVGTATSGLPYPFLNNMEFDERLLFYGVNLLFALAAYLAIAVITNGLRRLFRFSANP